MIKELRHWYNSNFTTEKYHAMLDDIAKVYNHRPPFRIAETPFFIPEKLKARLIEACNEISETILNPDFKSMSEGALKLQNIDIPKEDDHTTFLQMDFGVTLDENGDPFPMLIEIQGFPSVYFFQEMVSRMYIKHFDLPQNLSTYINGNNRENYIGKLKNIIVGTCIPCEVVMLEIEPEKQTTYIDFVCTAYELGIKVLCLTKVKKQGSRLYYIDENGQEITIKRIYNRVIFDELDQRPDLQYEFNLTDPVDVEWVGHPNWFFRISKYTMPILKSKYVPKSYFVDDLSEYPKDLENYVLKPLFSFAGAGVELNVTSEMLTNLQNKSNYILQQKVSYEPVIQSPNEPVKCEIRMLMLWDKDDPKPQIVNNLVRLSKGAMIGVKYNKDKDWVGGSVGFMQI